MHPLCVQVPPSPFFSIRQTLPPSCAALMAHVYPPGPPPIITTSYILVALSFYILGNKYFNNLNTGTSLYFLQFHCLEEYFSITNFSVSCSSLLLNVSVII